MAEGVTQELPPTVLVRADEVIEWTVQGMAAFDHPASERTIRHYLTGAPWSGTGTAATAFVSARRRATFEEDEHHAFAIAL